MVMGNRACVTHGATMVIPAPGFDPALTLQAVSQERCTSLYGVPTMFIAEWALPDLESYDLSSVRTGIMAGSPCPEEMMKKLISAGIDEMTIAYGMTETSRSPPRPGVTTPSSARSAPSAGCARTWRSRSSTRSAATPCRAARPGSSAPAATR